MCVFWLGDESWCSDKVTQIKNGDYRIWCEQQFCNEYIFDLEGWIKTFIQKEYSVQIIQFFRYNQF